MKRKAFGQIILLSALFAFGALFLYSKYADLNQTNYKVPNYVYEKNDFPLNLLNTSYKGPLLGCSFEDEIGFLEYKSKSPQNPKNNKFGLYIYAENEKYLKLADELVNSNGGDWGYVLIPFNVRDRDDGRWGRVFNELYKKHLIPVIQLHDIRLSSYKEDTKNAASFLNSFVWPVKERYISVYNEPNDAKFWVGHVSPAEYARVLEYTIDTFKAENKSFFMLNGALNASAPDNLAIGYMSANTFLKGMHTAKPKLFDKLDGWASHPYPQPNFAGSPHAKGLWSIRAYENELAILESLGVDKKLPVFITETGWAHAEGDKYNSSYVTSQKAGENLKIAFEEVWLKDDRVVAVMPFTIYYKAPYDHFSWVDEDYNPYRQFEIIKDLPKVSGTPFVVNKSVVNSFFCKKVL